jgi:hypothetical protein
MNMHKGQHPECTPVKKKAVRLSLAKLTEETINTKTKSGDTPLHRAARTGKIREIPEHLLRIELFLVTKDFFETPMHTAARHGYLDQIPSAFLTRETLTVSKEYPNKESRTGPTPPRTETPLHTAARYGYADQIPRQFLTPEFLSIEATGYRLTLLHVLAESDRLDLVPEIYANCAMWELQDSSGRTPRELREQNIQRRRYVEDVRTEPVTEKQKEKLRYFGYPLDQIITKGQASDAIDACVKNFPQKNEDYYNRPATLEQRAKLQAYGRDVDADFIETGEILTYGQAKDWIRDCEREAQRKFFKPLS